nr:hypothetical protein [uncultured Acetatifactor sp.]
MAAGQSLRALRRGRRRGHRVRKGEIWRQGMDAMARLRGRVRPVAA